ncbi:MAG: cyclodeaminase/cyclohydrolase family protein [Anaerovoracaceae bacterium]|jgi:formiminotetrahydrofolate cyclodeaminase
MTTETMADMEIRSFLDRLAGSSPTPGGGGAAALVGAVGAALGSMVGSLTVGRKKYAAVEEEIRRLLARAQDLRQQLLELIDEDRRAFAPLAAAYGLPTDSEEARRHKEEVMENCLRQAVLPPLKIMRVCCEVLQLLQEFAAKGSRLARSDAGVGAACCRAALQGASLNVFVNTRLMRDRERAAQLDAEAEEMLAKYAQTAEELFQQVREEL